MTRCIPAAAAESALLLPRKSRGAALRGNYISRRGKPASAAAAREVDPIAQFSTYYRVNGGRGRASARCKMPGNWKCARARERERAESRFRFNRPVAIYEPIKREREGSGNLPDHSWPFFARARFVLRRVLRIPVAKFLFLFLRVGLRWRGIWDWFGFGYWMVWLAFISTDGVVVKQQLFVSQSN